MLNIHPSFLKYILLLIIIKCKKSRCVSTYEIYVFWRCSSSDSFRADTVETDNFIALNVLLHHLSNLPKFFVFLLTKNIPCKNF